MYGKQGNGQASFLNCLLVILYWKLKEERKMAIHNTHTHTFSHSLHQWSRGNPAGTAQSLFRLCAVGFDLSRFLELGVHNF